MKKGKNIIKEIFLKGLLLIIFTIAALFAQWESDQRLTINDSVSWASENNARCIAASGDTVHVVWYDNRDGNWEIYYKRSFDGGISWGPDTRLTNGPADSWCPAITVWNSQISIVWHDNRDGNYEIYYRHSSDWGTTWGEAIRLINDAATSWYPSIAVWSSQIHVIWQDFRDNNDGEIYYKHSTDGGETWGPDTRLTDAPGASLSPSITVSGSNIHVAWVGLDLLTVPLIYYKRSTDGGVSWAGDILIGDFFGRNVSVASSGSNIHVVWAQGASSNDWKVYYRRSTDNGITWKPVVCLSSVSWYARDPFVTVSGSNVHVVWIDFRDGNGEIYYQRSTNNGATWVETRLTNDHFVSWGPSVAVGGSKVHVVWYDDRDGNYEIYYKRNNTGNPAVEEVTVQRPFQDFVAFPNPFTFFTIIPGHEKNMFVLYDISGRVMGTCKGDRIGEGLAAGVYFVRPLSDLATFLRIVKVK